jgi:superfamily II RNA helicase
VQQCSSAACHHARVAAHHTPAAAALPHREEQPDAIREKFVSALLRGIAVHHAGCLPGWKTLVEKLFQQGLLKVR